MDGESEQPPAEAENGTDDLKKEVVESDTADAVSAPDNVPQEVVKGN